MDATEVFEALRPRRDLLAGQTGAIGAKTGVKRIRKDTASRGDADERNHVQRSDPDSR